MQAYSNQQLKDEDVVHRIINEGEPSWFEVLYSKYYTKVLDKCYSMLKDKALAHEMTKDILSKAYEKLHSFKGQSTFSSWLYAIAYNHCIDYLRSKKKLHYPNWNQNNDIPEIIDEDNSLAEVSLIHLEKAMENIHPEEKALLIMRYEYNLSFKQISESLRITESAAKMRMKRAKSRLLYLINRFENS